MTFDEQKYKEVVAHAYLLAKDRQAKYGDSVAIMRDDSIVDLVLTKLLRTRVLRKDDPKYKDELTDCINYLVFLQSRMR